MVRPSFFRSGVYPRGMRSPLLTIPAVLAVVGCAHVLPTLGAVLSRVDIPTVIRCASEPTPLDRAKCIGLQFARPAVDEALIRAARLADEALGAAGPAGADDYTDAQRQQLAVELEAALSELESEIAKAEADSYR